MCWKHSFQKFSKNLVSPNFKWKSLCLPINSWTTQMALAYQSHISDPDISLWLCSQPPFLYGSNLGKLLKTPFFFYTVYLLLVPGTRFKDFEKAPEILSVAISKPSSWDCYSFTEAGQWCFFLSKLNHTNKSLRDMSVSFCNIWIRLERQWPPIMAWFHLLIPHSMWRSKSVHIFSPTI